RGNQSTGLISDPASIRWIMRQNKEMERNPAGLKREFAAPALENLREQWSDFKNALRFVAIWGVRKMQ
ncbi:hypothetical protein, partial [Brucella melitensis]